MVLAEEDRAKAIRRLWGAATYHWTDAEELYDSATALPGEPMKGKELYRIGVTLGLIDEQSP